MTDFTKNSKMQQLKIEDHINPPECSGLFKIYYNNYWIVSPDGEHIYNYGGYSFQCNKNKNVVESLLKSYKDCTIKQIERLYFEE